MRLWKNNVHFVKSTTYNCIRTKRFDHPDIPHNATERQNAHTRGQHFAMRALGIKSPFHEATLITAARTNHSNLGCVQIDKACDGMSGGTRLPSPVHEYKQIRINCKSLQPLKNLQMHPCLNSGGTHICVHAALADEDKSALKESPSPRCLRPQVRAQDKRVARF